MGSGRSSAGPPVMATVLAEIYGPDAASRRAIWKKSNKPLNLYRFVVDIDNSIGERRPDGVCPIDQDQLGIFWVEQQDVYDLYLI